jgi:hypothetical protein
MSIDRDAVTEQPPFDGSLDEYPELLDGWFQAECAELWKRKLSPEDKDLREKAINLLRYGATKTLQGHPPPAFLRFVAVCLLTHIDGHEPSLDHAFRLKAKKGRKVALLPSKEISVIEAFSGAMYQSQNEKRSKKARVDAALIAAFKVHHGWKPALHELDGERMRATRKVLRRYGNL